MIGYLLKRALHAVLVLVVVSLLAFVLGDAIGDPVASILGMEAGRAEAQLLGRRRITVQETVEAPTVIAPPPVVVAPSRVKVRRNKVVIRERRGVIARVPAVVP